MIFIAEPLIPFDYWSRAAFYVRDVDMDDISFVALSLFLECKLWTGDKKLIQELKKKGFPSLITTQEIQDILQITNPGAYQKN